MVLRTYAKQHGRELMQFASYGAVSFGALVIDFAVYWGLLALVPYAFVAAVGGYVCGVVFHYALSSRVVFRSRFHQRGLVAETSALAKFFAAGLLGLLVTAVIVGILADKVGVNPLVAKLFAAGCSFIVVFVALRVFVFKHSEQDRLTAATQPIAASAV